MKVLTPSSADGPGRARDEAGIGGSERDRRRLRAALLGWHRARARTLRFRASAEPWGVLVAEFMAQQTQVARVDAAWVGFMAAYPSPGTLADAPTAEVVRAWAGLGYNRRAIHLQRAARRIVDDHGGRVPGSIDELERLPGVGPYTARAVAAVAFGLPAAAVDTNVRRVITRLSGEPMAPRTVQAGADELLAAEDAGTWTHAMMDLGATVCRPRAPACPVCPVAAWCASEGSDDMPSGALPRAPAEPFERSSRWLRGRIVASLREAPEDAWSGLPASIGTHDAAAIGRAVAALEADGLLERRRDGAVRLPSGAR